MAPRPLRIALYLCVLYFCCMAVAHFFGIKVPVLFVYYDTPYHAYQDKIIAFAVCAYIGLFLAAARHREVVTYALTVLGLTVLGLSAVNLSSALAMVLEEGRSTLPYWLQTGMIAGIFVVLVVLHVRGKRSGRFLR